MNPDRVERAVARALLQIYHLLGLARFAGFCRGENYGWLIFDEHGTHADSTLN